LTQNPFGGATDHTRERWAQFYKLQTFHKMKILALLGCVLISACSQKAVKTKIPINDDYQMMIKVQKEIGIPASMDFYRVQVLKSPVQMFKNYIELYLLNPVLGETYDTISLPKAAAYRLYLNLNETDKKSNEAIKVILKNNPITKNESYVYFTMEFLKSIYKSELAAREYMQAVSDGDSIKVRNMFNREKFKYSLTDLDSINLGFCKTVKSSYAKSRLYNWLVIQGKDAKYRLLIFVTDTSNIYNVHYEIDMYDSLRADRNIVSIEY
jgi:hypothetical protein